MFLVGTSGVLGRHIALSPAVTIATRALLAVLLLWAYCRFMGFSFQIGRGHRLPIVIGGVLLGGHWVTYFYSLQLSNVAIGMLSLFTYPIITAFLEPLLLKTRFQWMHLVLALLVLTGIFFLVPDFSFKNTYTLAIAIGLFSALLYSLRNIIMKQPVMAYNGSSLMVWQLVVVTAVLCPFFFSTEISEVPHQLPWILILALLTTAVGHTLFLVCFRYFSITSISILSCIQPIYGIILGMLFLREFPDQKTLLGGGLILVAVVIEGFRNTSKA